MIFFVHSATISYFTAFPLPKNTNIVPATTAKTDPKINGAPGFILVHSRPAISEEKKVQVPIIVW
jgi:hypothetical protein